MTVSRMSSPVIGGVGGSRRTTLLHNVVRYVGEDTPDGTGGGGRGGVEGDRGRRERGGTEGGGSEEVGEREDGGRGERILHHVTM